MHMPNDHKSYQFDEYLKLDFVIKQSKISECMRTFTIYNVNSRVGRRIIKLYNFSICKINLLSHVVFRLQKK